MKANTENMQGVITVDMFNKLTGQETLHPLVSIASLSDDRLGEDLRMPCSFYALICRSDGCGKHASLRMVRPGEMFEIPSACHCASKVYEGVIFHPDLLCDTPLERHIGDYPTRCSCHGTLTEQEQRTIEDCLAEIDKELHHSIDRHSGTIIVSQIELLLNYCTRFCSYDNSNQ